ncbi:MAG: hypothetical protein ACREV3_11645, partial [Gammaproteobacteria bacterium]
IDMESVSTTNVLERLAQRLNPFHQQLVALAFTRFPVKNQVAPAGRYSVIQSSGFLYNVLSMLHVSRESS